MPSQPNIQRYLEAVWKAMNMSSKLLNEDGVALIHTIGSVNPPRAPHRWITKYIERAQKKVEENNFGIRKRLLEYDDVMNLQRSAIYEMRRRALAGEDIEEMIFNYIAESHEDA